MLIDPPPDEPPPTFILFPSEPFETIVPLLIILLEYKISNPPVPLFPSASAPLLNTAPFPPGFPAPPPPINPLELLLLAPFPPAPPFSKPCVAIPSFEPPPTCSS